MSESDRDNAPPTPTPQRASPPSDPWCDPSKTLVERAAMLREGRVARARVVLFQTLVSEMPMRRDSTPPDAPALSDLFGATFGDPTGREFWHLRLQAWVDPAQFAEMLATFLAAEGGDKATHKLAVSATLTRDLTAARKVPPVVERANSPIVGQIDPATGQIHAFVVHSPNRLEGDSFDPGEPLRWMAEREIFHDLLPASLLAFLRGTGERPVEGRSIAPQASGRPYGTSLDVLDRPFVERIVSMVRSGEMSSTAAAARAVVGDGAGVPGGGEAGSKADRLRRKATTALKAGE